MSSIGRLQGGTASLDFSVDLNTASLSSIVAQEQKISDLQDEIYEIENEIKDDVHNRIGDMGKVVTIDEETGESTTTKTSVRENLETLYEIITGVAAVTGQEELAVPLIGLKALYDEGDHLYQQGHSIYEAINNFKNLVGNPHSSGEIQDTDEDGYLLWHDDEQTNPIYKTIPPSGLHARAYDLENMLYKKEWWPNYTKDDTTKFNMLRLENWEEGGEIHFITRIANDYNGIEFGTFQEKKQYYNTKIGTDGKLYCWYKQGYIPDPLFTWDDEWIDITDKIADNSFQNLGARVDITILQAAVFGIGGTQALAGTTKETIQVGAYTLWETIKGTFTVSAGVIGGTLAGYYVANRNKEDLQKANKYLEDQLIKIANKEAPYDALTDEDLAELEQAYIDKIQEGINEIKELDKQNINEIGFLHSDLLTDSKFEIDDTNKLISSDLNHLVDNIGVKGTNGTSTKLFKDVEDIIAEIGDDNQDITSTGIHKNIYDIFNLIGHKTLTTPPKDPTGIFGQIEEIQELLGISDDTETGETTLISRIETNENAISTIQGNITTIDDTISGIETELGTSPQDGISINTKIADLQTYTGITNPLPTKSLKEEIDSIRTITGYDDSSLLYLLLPPNQDGTIPSIQENTINNNSLIHLGYKGTALKENFSDYFILYVMPHYSITTDITIANYYLVRDLVSNKDPSSSGLQIQNATDEYLSALRGYIQYDDIILSNDWYFSIYIKNIQSYNSSLYKYNNIEVLINENQLVVTYQKYVIEEQHYLNNVWTGELQINIINYWGRSNIVSFTNISSYYLNHSLTFLAANPNRQLSDYYNMFLDNAEAQKGFNMYPFKNSNGDYIVYHTGANFAPFNQWKISVARNWTYSSIIGGQTIYIRIFIMATNTLPSSYADFSMIYESDVLSLSQAQYTSNSNFTLNTGNNTGYNYWLIGYIYTNSAGNIITDHDTNPIMIGKVRQLLVEEKQSYQTNQIISNHSITFDNDFKHLVLNDRVASENKIVYYADGVEKGTIDIPSDRVLINNNNFLLGDSYYVYRSFGIGNGILTTQTLDEISQLAKTNYRVRIPELSVMDEVYITETLILENDIQFRNKVDGSTFNYYTETSGSRRRQAIQENGVIIDTFTYTDELIFRTPPTQNQFLFYNSTTGLFEGVTTDFYTKADIDSKGYLTETELNTRGYITVNDIPSEYITETELNTRSYITVNDIPSDYITETELNNKGYLTTIPSEYITETELNTRSYITANDIPSEYITETELDSRNYITASSIPDNIVDTTELDSRNYISYDDFSKNQASEINPGIVKYNDITERFYTVDKIQKEDVDGLIDTIQNIPNVYTFSEQFPLLNHLILDRYFQQRATEYLELYVKYNDFIYTLAPHLYIEYTYLGVQQSKSTYDTTAINIHKHDIIRFKAEQISSDNEALYTHQYYFKDELGNIMTNDGGLPKKYLDTATNWIQDTEYPLNYKLQLYRSNRDETNTNEILLATFNIIQEAYEIEFKPDVIPKVVQDITKIDNDLQINFSDSTNTTINILDNSLVKNIEINGGFLNYTQLDDTVVSRTLPFIENDVDAVLTFFEGTSFTRNGANKIDLLQIDTFNENIIINGSASYGSGSIQLNCENNTHNVKIIAPSHSSFTGGGGDYTLTLPIDLGTNGQVLAINPNSLTRNGRLYWTDRINITDFNASQFELSGSLISIKSSVLGGGSGGSISIADFDNTQFETNTAGEISIIPSVLGTGSIINYNDLNVPGGQEEVTQTVDVIPSVDAVEPQPIYEDTTEKLQYLAEQKTGVKGWRLVRFLPPTSSTWYSPNDNALGTAPAYGTAYDYTNEWSVDYGGTFNEMFFSTKNMVYWLWTPKSSVDDVFTNEGRLVYKSSNNSSQHNVAWYNRDGTDPDPFISVLNHSTLVNQCLYAENSFSSAHTQLIPGNEGMCVFVRTSTDTATVNPEPEYKYLTFTYDSANDVSGQTPYTLTFDNPTECDILIVGGGGGGGKRGGGAGGAGALLYHKNVSLNGTYNIKVGNGGRGNSGILGATTNYGLSGYNSEIIDDGSTILYRAKGGGGGQGGSTNTNTGGGSSGGGTWTGGSDPLSTDNIFNGSTVSVSANQYVNSLPSPEGCRGNIGGTQTENYKGGGGGGAGSAGQNHGLETTTNDGYGGLGLTIDITGTPIVYAGGGNGGNYSTGVGIETGVQSQSFNPLYPTIESRGGGGYGSDNGNAQNGLDGTGGGGGGQGSDITGVSAGDGGSGIVIIRYKTTYSQTITEGTGTSQSGYMKYDGTTWDLVDIEIADLPTKLTDLSTEGFTLTTAEISDFPTIPTVPTTINEITNGEIFKSLLGMYVINESMYVEFNVTVGNNITASGNTNVNNIQVNNSFNSSCLIEAHDGITVKGGGIYIENVADNTFYSERLIQGNGGLLINGNTTINDRAIIYDGLYVGSVGYESWMYISPQGATGLFGIDYVSSAIRPFWGGSYQAIMANGNIATNGWLLAYSDERIKTDIEDLDDTECLNILNQIKPVKYHYKDPARRGEHKTIGYIAQQIKEVLPNAVKLQRGYLPNILEIAKYDLETNIIELDDACSFTPTSNLNIKIMDKKEHNDITITDVIDDKHFKIDTTLNTSNIYVYGSLTDDIHTINKEAINAVHLSASQELHRMIVAQQQIIDDLKTRIEALENI